MISHLAVFARSLCGWTVNWGIAHSLPSRDGFHLKNVYGTFAFCFLGLSRYRGRTGAWKGRMEGRGVAAEEKRSNIEERTARQVIA